MVHSWLDHLRNSRKIISFPQILLAYNHDPDCISPWTILSKITLLEGSAIVLFCEIVYVHILNILFIYHHPLLQKLGWRSRCLWYLRNATASNGIKINNGWRLGKNPFNGIRIVSQVVLKHWNMYVWENPALAERWVGWFNRPFFEM